MPETQDLIFTVFKKILAGLEELSESEVAKLCDPGYSVEIKTIKRRVKDNTARTPDEFDIDSIITEISELPSRMDAHRLLNDVVPFKKQLELIARRLDIPIIRQDNLEALRDKVIEATVGARIRSEAIQGTNARPENDSSQRIVDEHQA